MVDEIRAAPARERPVGELVGDASEQLSRLVRDEMRLAVAELQQKGKRTGVGAGLFGVAAVLAFYGGAALVACVVLALASALAGWLAALLVGVALLLVAGVTALIGVKQVRAATPPVPQEAVSGVQTDIETVKEGLRR
ncbi:phage holin family protein [Nocardia wallacei]|uniref:phage holin family protein n=1 Tax=Nocardia wallacei TaxID=480035 RepID=UPI00245829D8|nr:phage holin family protein [Nocardia wallacei]